MVSRRAALAFGLALAAVAHPATATTVAGQEAVAPSAPGEGLPVVVHTLPNGMTILVLERRQSPTVALVVHFPVGSVNERLGNTGIAHVVEHMLFKGTEEIGVTNRALEVPLLAAVDSVRETMVAAMGRPRPDTAAIRRLGAEVARLEDRASAHVVPNEFDRILASEGARGLNATTSHEATRYFVELPANRIELWFALEADRMSNPVFREFHTELDVVWEERRLRLETSPGGILEAAFLATAFQVHPYGVPVIGHAADLDALTRGQAEEYFRSYYGARNAVVAVVGDIEAARVLRLAEEYFGVVPSGRAPPPVSAREPEQRGERRITVEYDAEPRLLMGWRAVSALHEDAPALSMLASLLTAGRTTRLYRRLIADDRSAIHVAASLGPGTLHPRLFTISAIPRSPHTTEEIERTILEEVEAMRSAPPDPRAMERIRNQYRAGEFRRLSSNLELAMQLAEAQASLDDWRQAFRLSRRIAAVTPEDVQRVARRYLVPETRTVAVMVRGGGAVRALAAVRPPATLVALAALAALAAPTPQRAQAQESVRERIASMRFPEMRFTRIEPESHTVRGVPVRFHQDRELPLVTFYAAFDGGVRNLSREHFAAASALPNLLRTGGAAALPPDSVDERVERMGLALSFGQGGGGASSWVNSLTEHSGAAVRLWASMLREPRFDSAQVERWRGTELERVRRARDDPATLAFGRFNHIMYGDHPVGWEMDDADLEPADLAPERLRHVHRAIICPENMVIGVTGDLTWERAAELLEEVLDGWPPCSGALLDDPVPVIRQAPGVFVIHKEIEQSVIVMAHASGLRQGDTPQYFASRAANAILGASGLSSRLAAQVRTREGLAYGASSLWTTSSRHEGLVGALTRTRPETTLQATRLILATIDSMRAAPPSEEEVARIIDETVNGYVFNFRTPLQVITRGMAHRALGLPDDWLERYLRGIQRVTPRAVRDVLRREVEPARMTILLVGDTARFDGSPAELGPVTVLDEAPTGPPPEDPPADLSSTDARAAALTDVRPGGMARGGLTSPPRGSPRYRRSPGTSPHRRTPHPA